MHNLKFEVPILTVNVNKTNTLYYTTIYNDFSNFLDNY